jgi:response regulator RpfG family c-di-GMP phosphodiesterase
MFVRDKTTPIAGKILIVNPDPEIARILEVNLAHANLEVALANNGAEALQLIRRDKSDIIILDQEFLDTEDGVFNRHIKELSDNVPVIIIGSRSKKRNIATGADDIAVSYITKPFDPKEVVALVQGYLMHKERTVNIGQLSGLPERIPVDKVVNGEKGKGTNRTVSIPKKWHSGLHDIDTLQLAMDINRKEARKALKNIQHIVASLLESVPPELKDSLDRLAGDVQEMAVLCNRSLYLAADYNHRREIQQNILLQHESGQMAMLEAILTICRNMTKATTPVKHLFDPESVKRVAKYALVIARELKMPDTEQQALYHAALLKDLALAFSRPEFIEDTASTSHEMAAALKERLNFIWKALAAIPYFSPACHLLLYKQERFDGTGGSFGLKGNDIPLGARILAVAEAFNILSSERSLHGRTAPRLSIPQIVAESGLSFDPHIVSVLLMLLSRNELEYPFTENIGEIDLGVTSG